MAPSIPRTADRSTLAASISSFLKRHPHLHLSGDLDIYTERRRHLDVFGFHNLEEDKRAPIGKVEFTAARGLHGTIPLRLFYPKEVTDRSTGSAPALIYMHGGGYTIGSVDEFENGLRLLAEASGVIVSSSTIPLIIAHCSVPKDHCCRVPSRSRTSFSHTTR